MAEITDIYDEVSVAEMTAGSTAHVALDPNVVSKIKSEMEDDNPQFPVLRIESGVSKNKFEWTPEILADVAEQINAKQPVGYLGHIKPEDEKWVLPPPQTWWLKAVTKNERGKTVLYVKGYNLPDEPIRKYVKVGAVNSASWHGKASVQHLRNGIQRITKFALDSIDWSRKGKNAMPARLVALAAEMEGKQVTIRERVSAILDDRFEDEPLKATLKRLILMTPVGEMQDADDDALTKEVWELLDSDPGMKFLIHEMGESPYVTRGTRNLPVNGMAANLALPMNPKGVGSFKKTSKYVRRGRKIL